MHLSPEDSTDASLYPSPNLPSGTLTFLFTDVEGSTRLWEQFPDRMREATIRHDALIEAAVAQWGGIVVRPRGEGDSRFAVFTRATDAIAAAEAIQRALFAEPWAVPSPVRVRIALHTGEADLRDGDYYGPAVNRCARLRSVAHGGQTLVSQVTYDLTRDALPGGVSLRDLGEHNLKDLKRTEHVYQLVIAGLPAEFPPLRAPESFHTNLPTALTSFIGREREIAEVKRLLTLTRLLTITGVGGAGKTRLALQVATDLLDSFADGVWLIELAPLSDSSLVTQLVANSLGIREEEGRPLIQTLVDSLPTKRLLLILDNCEHLVQGVAQLAQTLLSGAPKLCILATSREPLGVAGEMAWSIPPLSSPGLHEVVALGQLTQYDTVKLFIDRAIAVKPDFVVSNQNAPAVAQICARLDGIPLAIELAASRVKVLPAEEIATRLDDRFRLLVSGSRTALPRQQTLRALIDWSHDLLTESERVLLRRLSVFAGGWTLQAAEEVCSGTSIEAWEVLDLLARLIDKSLVVAELQEGRERYRFMEMIRQYGQERLAESKETDEIAHKHAQHFMQMAKESYGELWGSKQGYWLARLETEHDNLRAALEWMARDVGREEMLLEIAGSLWRFWEIHGYISEGRAWLENALARNPDAPPYLRANGLRGAGRLARQQGDYAQAKTMHEQSLALFRAMGLKLGIARELDALGEIAQSQGNYARAIELHTESLALRYEIDDKEGIAVSLGQLGNIARSRGQYQYARELLEQSLELNRETGDKLYTALSLNNLGLVACLMCEYERAISLFEEAVSLYRELNDRLGISNTLHNLGNVAKDRGDMQRATTLYQECLALKQELGDKHGIARVMADLAEVAVCQGNYARAAELTEQSLTLFRELGGKPGIIVSSVVQAFVAHYQGDYERASSLGAESLALSTELDLPRGIAYAKEVLGLSAYAQERLAEAKEHLEEAIASFRKVNDRRNVAYALANLARTAYRQDDHVGANRFLDESLSISRELDIRWSLAFSLEITGLLQRSQGNYGRALGLFQESVHLSAEQANQQGIANCLGALAGLAAMTGQPIRAAHLFAAAEKLRQAIGARMGSDDRQEYEIYLDVVRHQLDEADFTTAWSEGCAMTTEQAIEEASIPHIGSHM
jgi:predicted ATPase/class 3 adenylate cyclase/Tfp pilus assembly protein PilF